MSANKETEKYPLQNCLPMKGFDIVLERLSTTRWCDKFRGIEEDEREIREALREAKNKHPEQYM